MGTTAEKINYAINATNDIAEGINNIGGNITQNTELADFREELDILYRQMPKTSQDGTSITLANTRRGKLEITPKGNTVQDGIPSEYQVVEYIQTEGNGGQYINTGVLPTFNTEIEAEFMSIGTTNSGFIYGSRGGNTKESHTCILFANAKDWYPQFAQNTNPVHLADTHPELAENGVKYRIKNGKNGFYINDILIKSYNETELDSTYPMYIFGLNQAGELEARSAIIKLYSFRIYESDELIREYIPCYRKSDNEIGLYETITNTFYTNEGTGSFTKGNDAYLPNPSNKRKVKVVTGENAIHVGNITKTLNLGNIELAKIGNYSDFIFKNEKSSQYYDNTLIENAWYKKQIIKSKVYDENNDFQLGSASTNDYYIFQTAYGHNILDAKETGNIIICDNFEFSNTEGDYQREYVAINPNAYSYVRFHIASSRLSEKSVNAFKNWLETHNVLIYYILENPIYTQITDTTLISQLEEINSIIGNGGTVVIETESEEENAQLIVNASALASFENN